MGKVVGAAIVKEDITKMQQLLCKPWPSLRLDPFCVAGGPIFADSGHAKIFLRFHWTCPWGREQTYVRGASQMEMEISEKIQRLTRILSEEANKFPRITVDQYSTGTYGYDWKVYLDRELQLGTIAFTTHVTLSA